MSVPGEKKEKLPVSQGSGLEASRESLLTHCVGQNITEPAHVQRQGTQISHLSGKNVKSFAVIFNPLQPETNPKGKYAYSTAG